MSDLTVYAEALIATVARAFYDDEAVCLIDVLIRDKFLRDDDMAPRLSLPARKLRSTLQFLQEEHLVKFETVDDLTQGGSQQTKFWYIDYNHAVHTIRLRLHLLRKSLEQAEMRARSSSFYLCPGYKDRRCNGRYTEEEAQQIVDHSTGLFLCQECFLNYEADPNAPPKSTYSLQLVDNTKDLRRAMDDIRRVTVQLSAKMIGNQQIRPGIYDLLQKIRGKTKVANAKPITSNLPTENFALGIGSKRLAGTGRTAGIKARKLEQQGVADSATAARNYLVGGTGKRSAEGSDLTFLKNAMGNEIAFSVEKGGGARANLLATRTRRHRKLMEAAASRVGASLPLDVRILHEELKKRKRQSNNEQMNGNDANNKKGGDGTDNDNDDDDEDDNDDSNNESSSSKNNNGKKKNKKNNKKQKIVKTTQGQPSNIPLTFLDNNIGREGLDKEMERLRKKDMEGAMGDDDDDDNNNEDNDVYNNADSKLRQQGIDPHAIILDDTEDMPHLWEEDKRKSAFQLMYSKEMSRQVSILNIDAETTVLSSPPKASMMHHASNNNNNANNANGNGNANGNTRTISASDDSVSTDTEDHLVEWEDV